MDDRRRTPAMNNTLPRFLLDQLATPGERVDLAADEAHHARVRRLATGDRVALFDGKGRSYLGTVEHASAKGLAVRVDEALPIGAHESPLALTLAIALLKSDRFEWMIEKTTELGVTRLRPFTSEHSLARPSAARQTRWRTIAVSAAKQCGRSVVPQIEAPCDFDQMLAAADTAPLLFWERSTTEPRLSDTRARATIIVGPEGGFSEKEVARASEAGCQIATLGPRILRAETAAVAAVTLTQSTWGDLARVPSPGSLVPG
jgi:16S rRNA (uracil1498-N3)-methyltransferase